VGYLPIIDASPTEMSTVTTILTQSIDIANKLDLKDIVLVMDQAIYAKAQEIRWQNEEFERRIIIRLGEFHTVMMFLGVIGKRFRDAGLEDVMIESGIVASGSMNGVMNGHHYNRSMRSHKIVAEALQKLRFEAFLQTCTEEELHAITSTTENLAQSFLQMTLNVALESNQFQVIRQKYDDYVSKGNETNVNFAFWSSYLHLVQILMLFVRATREGDWPLHLSALRSMVPWSFIYI